MVDVETALPKEIKENYAELHIHLEGALEPELMVKFAKRNGVKLDTYDVEKIRAKYNFSNLQEFVDIICAGSETFMESEDYFEVCEAYFKRLQQTDCNQVEAFFCNKTQAPEGQNFSIPFEGVARSFKNSEQNYGIKSKLIYAFERHLGVEAANKCFDQMMEYIANAPADEQDLIIGVGLVSSEKPFPPAPYAGVYERARQAGFNLTAHAGEEGGPDYIWSALDDLGVSRIDHGVR
ncbi:MAG: hypothetical protein LBM13_04210, partial [Candidatus Ancillula sp.]|nr:hypothetical protein [Candidatus Ancillula sp.]